MLSTTSMDEQPPGTGTDLQFRADGSDAGGDVVGFEITVVASPSSSGGSLRLDRTAPARVLVGTSTACDLVLVDRLVSRRHLAFDVVATGLRVTDLGSTNGTFVAGLRVLDAVLRGGEHVVVGETTLEITRVTAAAAAEVPLARGFGRLVGSSLAMRRRYPVFERLAASTVPLIVEGETGTGKELLAEMLHERSPRAQGPFVVLDCASAQEDLTYATLFGDVRPASAQRGVFDRADGGTLLLDEVGELDEEVQVLLLSALERGEVQPIGADGPARVSVRVIATSRQDLERAVQEGRFREDLFYRLAVTRVELPPLREREGDVGVLARHFWARLGGRPEEIPYDAFERFERSDWPGNVRELYGAVAQLLIAGEERAPTSRAGVAPSRPTTLERYCDVEQPYVRAKEELIRAFEREYVEAMMRHHGGNTQRAAAASGLALRYFQLLRAKHRG